MTTHSTSEKQILRREALRIRQTLPLETLSRDIALVLEQSPVFSAATCVLAYAAFREEVDLSPLIARHPEKNWYLPRVQTEAGAGAMQFLRHQPGTPLESGSFGIPEPPAGNEPLSFEQDSALVLLPGLLFDRRGYRLGYGKGFYDRFTATLPPNWTTVGVIPQALLRDTIPTDPWDLPVQWLATETGGFAP